MIKIKWRNLNVGSKGIVYTCAYEFVSAYLKLSERMR